MNEEEAKAKLRLIQIQKERLALQQQEAPAPPPVEAQGVGDYARGLVQSVNKGSMLDFGDEIVGAGRALIDPLLPNFRYDFGEGSSNTLQRPDDSYAMYRDDERDVIRQFEEENPGTALAANVVGGVISPVNRIAPGVGRTGNAGQRAMSAALRGTVEGGVVGLGAGEGDLGSQLDSMKTGAMFGGGAAGGLSLVGGGLGRLASNKRIQEDLIKPARDAAGRIVHNADGSVKTIFQPINLADPESSLGKVYRDIVGVAYGGGKIGKQESAYLRNALRRTGQNTDELIPDAVGTRNAVADVQKSIVAERDAAKSAIKSQTNNTVEDIAQQRKGLERTLRNTVDAVDDRVDETVAQNAARTANNTAKVRAEAAKSALPEADRVVFETIDPSDTRAAKSALDEFWGREGGAFRMVKDRAFDWEGGMDEGIKKNIAKVMSEDPELAIKAGREVAKIDGMIDKLKSAGADVKEMVPEDFIKEMLSSPGLRDINGDALMEIRNAFATASNKGVYNRSAREVADQIDDLILDQLGRESKEAADFIAHKDVYGNYVAYKKAFKKASSKSGGDFSVEQYRTAADSVGGGGANAPLDELTLPIQREINTLSEVKAATKAAAKAEKRQANRGLQQTKEVLEEQQKKAKKSGSHKQNRQNQLARARKNYAERELRGATIENPSSGNKAVATFQLGLAPAALLGPLGLGSAFGAGLATAPLLATQRAQRMVAGQLPSQEWLAKALRTGKTAAATQALSRTAASMASGEEP
jgi:hypothetical protein